MRSSSFFTVLREMNRSIVALMPKAFQQFILQAMSKRVCIFEKNVQISLKIPNDIFNPNIPRTVLTFYETGPIQPNWEISMYNFYTL